MRYLFIQRLTDCCGESQRAGVGVRREKVALSSGCKPRPANAPAGNNRSSYGGNEVAEAFGDACCPVRVNALIATARTRAFNLGRIWR